MSALALAPNLADSSDDVGCDVPECEATAVKRLTKHLVVLVAQELQISSGTGSDEGGGQRDGA